MWWTGAPGDRQKVDGGSPSRWRSSEPHWPRVMHGLSARAQCSRWLIFPTLNPFRQPLAQPLAKVMTIGA